MWHTINQVGSKTLTTQQSPVQTLHFYSYCMYTGLQLKARKKFTFTCSTQNLILLSHNKTVPRYFSEHTNCKSLAPSHKKDGCYVG